MIDLTEDQRAQAYMALEEFLIPSCVECMTTRDLWSCGPCTDAGDSIMPFCTTCLVKHREETPECRDEEGAPCYRISPEYRFTHWT